jgi:hypothetical protein
MKYFLIITVIVLFIVMGFVTFGYTPYETSATKTNSFYIDENFDIVRKVLVRAPSLEKMVELSHGVLIEKKQEQVDLSIEKLSLRNPNWMIEAGGYFKVRHQNGYLKNKILTLRQNVRLTKDCMDVHISLTEPVATLLEHDVTQRLERDGGKTKVTQTVTMKIQYRIIHTKRIKAIVDTELDKAISECIAEEEHGIREVVRIYKERPIHIPIIKSPKGKPKS